MLNTKALVERESWNWAFVLGTFTVLEEIAISKLHHHLPPPAHFHSAFISVLCYGSFTGDGHSNFLTDRRDVFHGEGTTWPRIDNWQRNVQQPEASNRVAQRQSPPRKHLREVTLPRQGPDRPGFICEHRFFLLLLFFLRQWNLPWGGNSPSKSFNSMKRFWSIVLPVSEKKLLPLSLVDGAKSII